MSTETPTPGQTEEELSPAIVSLLEDLRNRIRLYVWAEGIAITVAFIGIAFWLAFGLDYFLAMQGGLGLPRAARAVIVGLIVLGFGYVTFRYIVMRAFMTFSDRSMAVLLERRFKQFHDSLVTTIELRGTKRGDPYSKEMLAHTYSDANTEAGNVQVKEVFNPRPLWQASIAAVVLTLSILVFAVTAGDTFWIGFKRITQLSNELWPRRVELEALGFDKDGVLKIARGSEHEFQVRAKLNRHLFPKTEQLEFPKRVNLYYQDNEGGTGRTTMEFKAAPPDAPHQDYQYKFQGLLATTRVDVRADDGMLRNLQIVVVDSPKLNNMLLKCVYPPYMHKSPADIPATGAMVVPFGTKVTLLASANKELVKVDVSFLTAEGKTVPPPAEDKVTIAKDRKSFEFPIVMDGSKTLQFTLHDTDGIFNREPVRLALSSSTDEIPLLTVRRKGIGEAVTQKARIPIVGNGLDDYGLEDIWFEYEIEGGKTIRKPFAKAAGLAKNPRTDFTVDEVFDLLDFDRKGKPEATTPEEASAAAQEGKPAELLKPGQKFTLAVRAKDGFALGKAPNEGTSEKFAFEVVTDDQLRTILELRELNQRQTFEAVIAEMYDTRDALVRLSPDKPKQLPGKVEPKKEEKKAEPKKAQLQRALGGLVASGFSTDSLAFQDAKEAEKKEPEKEGEKKEAPAEKVAGPERPTMAEEAAGEGELDPVAVRTLRTQRAQQNSKKNASETLQVAVSFQEMVEELDNNRIESLELKSRLQNDIASKLNDIAVKMFPELDKRLVNLQKNLSDEKELKQALAPTVDQANKILQEMEAVLEKMKEMEDFNELLVQLRKIIEDETAILDATKREQAAQLKKDLED